MAHLSRAEFIAIRKMAAAKTALKAAKRAVRVQENALLSGVKPAKKKRRKPSARKTAFKRLKDLCKEFVMLRAKRRTGGFCEIAMACQGRGPLEVAYHVTPQAMGNALKYDDRNLLGACNSCNGSEYFARKRGSSIYRERHAVILGPVFAELEAAAGRRSISTAEAREMADNFQTRIEKGEWR